MRGCTCGDEVRGWQDGVPWKLAGADAELVAQKQLEHKQ